MHNFRVVAPKYPQEHGKLHLPPRTEAVSRTGPECHHPECMALDNLRCTKKQLSRSPPQREAVPPSPLPQSSPISPQPQFQARRPENRLFCDQCTAVPEGFRSEHELRRHSNREHKSIRKVWITVDASADKSFLSGCKACTTGKRYNECYNAASHLRRMHFHPRKRGEGREEGRNGKRGSGTVRSEDPSMEELKSKWLREVEETVGSDGNPIYRKDDRESSTEASQDTPITPYGNDVEMKDAS